MTLITETGLERSQISGVNREYIKVAKVNEKMRCMPLCP